VRHAIVAVANEPYVEHTKSLFGNLRTVGQWNGDLVLIANGVYDVAPFTDRGVKVEYHYDAVTPFHAKFWVFGEAIRKKYDRIMYLDADMLVKKPIAPMFDQDGAFLADYEPFKLREYFDSGADVYKLLDREYELDRQGFNTSCMLFDTRPISEYIGSGWLFWMQEKCFDANNHTGLVGGTDQPIINLLFNSVCEQIGGVCFVGDRKHRRQASLVHTTRWLAPWKEHKDYYERGLKAFEEMTYE